jgi:hypothetical protein
LRAKRSNPASLPAVQSWIASSLTLLAMTKEEKDTSRADDEKDPARPHWP